MDHCCVFLLLCLATDTPGLTAEDVNVELSPDNTVLTISGQRKHDTQTEKKDKQGHVHVRYHRQERSFFKFSR
jgi:HSP20 family molecular chaperone IbpA